MSIHIDTALVLALTLSVFIPGLSALVAREHWKGWVVGLITLAISTVNGFVLDWWNATDIHHYDWKSALAVAGVSYVLAVLGRVGIFKDPDLDKFLLSLPRLPFGISITTKGAHAAPAAPPAPPAA